MVNESEDRLALEFDLIHIEAPVANALRRILIAEVIFYFSAFLINFFISPFLLLLSASPSPIKPTPLAMSKSIYHLAIYTFKIFLERISPSLD